MDDSGNRVSSSKRPTMRDDDGHGSVTPSSVDQVMVNDDLVIEILLRLPVLTLIFFKSVSKRWLSLITSTAFFNLHLTRFPNIPPPSGLFLQQTNSDYDHFEHDFVSLVSGIPRGKLKKTSASPFVCFGSNASNVEVLQSCNGLVLCLMRSSATDKIYVYNPSINVFKMLPQVQRLTLEGFLDKYRLAFDPTKSPHYKVLRIRVKVTRPQNLFPTWIYSSETGCWRIGNTFHSSRFRGHFDNGVYWNDAINWINDRNRVMHFKLDVEHRVIITRTQLPETLHRKIHPKLFESRGCLLLAASDAYPHPKRLKIYERMNEYSWSVRYIIKYEDCIEASLKTWKMSTVGFHFNVLFMVVGEREEESFVVMDLLGMVVKYNLLSKTLHVLYGIHTNLTPISAFPFIASFAGV
uniref:F-box protein At5g07610-like n=1 Tax=Erigeron canadensis TaxID=72917 RepID=UPI001CB99421|nr:F-box protein At5g07610-like [Erigeron canadensis]